MDFDTTLAAATGGGAAGGSAASLRAQPARIRAASGRMKDEASEDFWSLGTGNLPSGCDGYPPLPPSTAHGPGGAQAGANAEGHGLPLLGENVAGVKRPGVLNDADAHGARTAGRRVRRGET